MPGPESAREPVQMWGSNREKPWSAPECVPKLRSLGAAVVAARPHDREIQYPAGDFILTLEGLTAVEGFNPKVRQTANELAVAAAASRKPPGSGGSGAPGYPAGLGRAAAPLHTPGRDPQEAVSATFRAPYS